MAKQDIKVTRLSSKNAYPVTLQIIRFLPSIALKTLKSIVQYHMNQDLYHGQVSGRYRKSGPGFQQRNTRKFVLRLFRIMHVRGTDQIWKQEEGQVTGCVPFLYIYNTLFIMIVMLIKRGFISKISILRKLPRYSGTIILMMLFQAVHEKSIRRLSGSVDFFPLYVSCNGEKTEKISVLCHNRRNTRFYRNPPGR